MIHECSKKLLKMKNSKSFFLTPSTLREINDMTFSKAQVIKRGFSIAVNVPLVNVSRECLPANLMVVYTLYMLFALQYIQVCAMNTVQNVSLQSNMQLQNIDLEIHFPVM